MGSVDVEETLLVGAPPSVVYMVLADPKHHERILPAAFSDYKALDDSIVSFSIKQGQLVRNFQVKVEKVEENKLLRETDLATNIVTEFRLEPHEQGTLVTIATHYETNRSITGFFESIFAPLYLKRLYQEELIKLGRYVLLLNETDAG